MFIIFFIIIILIFKRRKKNSHQLSKHLIITILFGNMFEWMNEWMNDYVGIKTMACLKGKAMAIREILRLHKEKQIRKRLIFFDLKKL